MTKQEMECINEIVNRADSMALVIFDRVTLMMDLKFACKTFNLDVDGLLAAGTYDFVHDIVTIQRNINRRTKEFNDYFVPKFARPSAEKGGK